MNAYTLNYIVDGYQPVTLITRDGSDYVINGRKWWTTGASDPRCKVLIVMGRTNPDAASHQQQSMVLVPIETEGVTLIRSTPVFGSKSLSLNTRFWLSV